MMNINDIDWNNFSSCLLIETIGDQGRHWSLGVAVRSDIVLTGQDILQKDVLKINVFSFIGNKRAHKKFEVESFDLHPEDDVIRIKLASNLPKEIPIYPIMKSKNNFSGELFRIGFEKKETPNKTILIRSVVNSICLNKRYIEIFENKLNPLDSGSGIFLIRGGQIYLVAILSLTGACKKLRISKNPLVLGLNNWVESSWSDRCLTRF